MKMKEIREMTDAELKAQLEELLKERLNLKIQSRSGQLEKSARVREVRKDIAKIKTEQNSRLAQASV